MFKLPRQAQVHACFHGIPATDDHVPAGNLFVNPKGGTAHKIPLRKGELARGVEITSALGASGNIVAQIMLSEEPAAPWNFVLELQVKSSDGTLKTFRSEAGSAKSSIQGVAIDYEVSQ
jgi:hypothetical protein